MHLLAGLYRAEGEIAESEGDREDAYLGRNRTRQGDPLGGDGRTGGSPTARSPRSALALVSNIWSSPAAPVWERRPWLIRC